MKLREIFAENLAHFRLEAGLSKSELARRTGKSHRYITHLESGDANATLDVIESMAAALGRSGKDLFDDGKTILDLPPPRTAAGIDYVINHLNNLRTKMKKQK